MLKYHFLKSHIVMRSWGSGEACLFGQSWDLSCKGGSKPRTQKVCTTFIESTKQKLTGPFANKKWKSVLVLASHHFGKHSESTFGCVVESTTSSEAFDHKTNSSCYCFSNEASSCNWFTETVSHTHNNYFSQ